MKRENVVPNVVFVNFFNKDDVSDLVQVWSDKETVSVGSHVREGSYPRAERQQSPLHLYPYSAIIINLPDVALTAPRDSETLILFVQPVLF